MAKMRKLIPLNVIAVNELETGNTHLRWHSKISQDKEYSASLDDTGNGWEYCVVDNDSGEIVYHRSMAADKHTHAFFNLNDLSLAFQEIKVSILFEKTVLR